jgi:hypothetical protein
MLKHDGSIKPRTSRRGNRERSKMFLLADEA